MTQKQNKRRLFIVLIGIITVFTLYLVMRGDRPVTTVNQQEDSQIQLAAEEINAEFICSEDKTISAVFISREQNSVNLTLSDGREMDLPSVPSDDGGKYANLDESTVFWNSPDTTYLEENNVQTYQDCSPVSE